MSSSGQGVAEALASESDAITAQVRALEGLGLEALRAEWRRRYGPPPTLRSPDLLARLLAWRIQAAAFEGLKLALRKSAPGAGAGFGRAQDPWAAERTVETRRRLDSTRQFHQIAETKRR